MGGIIKNTEELKQSFHVTVYVTQEQRARLTLLHERTKVPISEYIRQGIELILEKNENMNSLK